MHTTELTDNARVFGFKGLETGEEIIHHASACGGGKQLVDTDSLDCDVGSFMLAVEAKVGIAPSVADG
jgi:hypothetical protein